MPLLVADDRFESYTGGWPRTESYWDQLGQIASGRKIAILWDGSQPNALYLFDQAPKFDLFVAEAASLAVDEEAVLVPRSMILQKFDDGFAQLRDTIANLKTSGARHIALVGTPPPKGDLAAIRRFLNNEHYYAQIIKASGYNADNIDIISPSVMLKIWYIAQEKYRQIAAEENVVFIAVPKAVRTEEGFLDPIYWSEDVGHANLTYGNLMRDHIASQVGKM